MNSKKRKSLALLIFATILLIAGIILLLVDPIKNHLRNKKMEEGISVIESQLQNGDETPITFVVPVNGNEVNGEDYDYFSEDPEEIERQRALVEEELAALGDNVTLTAIGILELDKIDLQVPVWDQCNVISLRYGVGHYEDSVLPGEIGNCSILGHHMRAYGSMFNRLGEMEVGDNIRVRTVGGHVYNYVVDEVIVVPASELNLHIGNNKGGEDEARITLVTCTYTSSGTQRLLVMGHLVND